MPGSKAHAGAAGGGAVSTALILLLCAALAIGATGCAHDTPGSTPGDSQTGLKGYKLQTGMFGGTEPAKGDWAEFVLHSQAGQETKVRIGSDGSFFVPLQPGRYTYMSAVGARGRPMFSGVSVLSGQVVDLGIVNAFHTPRPSARTMTALRQRADSLANHLKLVGPQQVTMIGATADGAQRLFGDASPTGDGHVWIVVFEARALRGGGYVACELDATTFAVLATRVSGREWETPSWVGESEWGYEAPPARL